MISGYESTYARLLSYRMIHVYVFGIGVKPGNFRRYARGSPQEVRSRNLASAATMVALDPGKASHGHALLTLHVLRTFGLDLFSSPLVYACGGEGWNGSYWRFRNCTANNSARHKLPSRSGCQTGSGALESWITRPSPSAAAGSSWRA
jgi:hypothetical protein